MTIVVKATGLPTPDALRNNLSITSELNAKKTEYTVVIVAGDVKTTSIIDANFGEVISTSLE